MKKIGEIYYTEEFGPVIVKDIYISITSQFRIYEVEALYKRGIIYFITGASLIDQNI